MASDQVTRRTLLGASAALAAATVAGCNSPDTSPPTQRRRLTIGASLEPGTLDPTISASAAIAQLLLYNVYETLVRLDNDGHLKPLLAQRWDVSNDRTTYTFSLERGASFASGAPVDAAAVVKSLERMRASTVASVKRQLEVVDTVRVGQGGTVEVHLKRPSHTWLYSMASTPGIVIDPAATDLATRPMGSGPFGYASWAKGDRIMLTKNPRYWGTPARFDEATFRYYTEPNAMVAAMLAGDLDIVSNLQSPQTVSQFGDTGRYTVLEGTTTSEVILGFNHLHPILGIVKVRQAINHAINRRALVDTIWAGRGLLIGSMGSPTEPFYVDLAQTYPYDPAKARQLLAEVGVSNLSLRLRVPTLPYATASARFISSQLAEVGITAAVEELDFSGRWLPEVFTKGDYDMTIVAHAEPFDIGNWADPEYYWHYRNPAFATLLAQADQGSQAEYLAKMKEAAQMLATEAVADFLFLLPNLVVTRSTISGVSPNAASLSFDLTTIASSSR